MTRERVFFCKRWYLVLAWATDSHHPRQSLRAQNSSGPRVPRTTSASPVSLHAHLLVLAQSGRDLVSPRSNVRSSRGAPRFPIWLANSAATSMPSPPCSAPFSGKHGTNVRVDGQKPNRRRPYRTSGQRTAKSIIHQGAKRRFGGCARKVTELTPGDLLRVASATEAAERQSDRGAEVSIGHSRSCRRQGFQGTPAV